MKFNKWTLGLAAVGVISLASVAEAEEQASSVMTALSSTTISGYVDTSAQWNLGSDTANFPPYKFGGSGKADGFNLNVVQIRVEKPLDESEWAAGYRVDLWAGPDANTLGTQSTGSGTGADFAVRQAYVALRAPVGNGVDFKVGVFDAILGYESVESPSNPNFTRSWGHSIEPQTHTGILASYKVNDYLSFSGGVANTLVAGINARDIDQTKKTYMGSVTLSAPDDLGFLSGSSFYFGAITGFGGGVGNTDDTQNYYAGAVLRTPVEGLSLGLAWDHVSNSQFTGGGGGESASVYGVYGSFQATEKLSLHLRGEYCEAVVVDNTPNFELTGTIQYDLWKNVISRLEARWDHANTTAYGGTTAGVPRSDNAYVLLANIIYKF